MGIGISGPPQGLLASEQSNDSPCRTVQRIQIDFFQQLVSSLFIVYAVCFCPIVSKLGKNTHHSARFFVPNYRRLS